MPSSETVSPSALTTRMFLMYDWSRWLEQQQQFGLGFRPLGALADRIAGRQCGLVPVMSSAAHNEEPPACLGRRQVGHPHVYPVARGSLGAREDPWCTLDLDSILRARGGPRPRAPDLGGRRASWWCKRKAARPRHRLDRDDTVEHHFSCAGGGVASRVADEGRDRPDTTRR